MAAKQSGSASLSKRQKAEEEKRARLRHAAKAGQEEK